MYLSFKKLLINRLVRNIIVFALAILVMQGAIYAQLEKKQYDVKKLAEGVYGFTWKDPMQNPIEGNSLFIINDSDVMVVDDAAWPSSAQTMINELKKLTNKPVRYVVNTHWHDDHVQGNFLYRQNWPGVEFIAHTKSREDLMEQTIKTKADILKKYKEQSAILRKWLVDGKDDKGKELDSARRKRVENFAEFYDESYREYDNVQYMPPEMLFNDSIIIYRGKRIIKLLWLGRGNTRGDIVIFLPNEKIAATGDLFVYPVQFAFGSYYKEWINTLGKVDALEADILFPGHGFPQYDRNYIRQVKDMLTSLVTEVDAAVKEGLTLEQTQKKVTLPEWKKIIGAGDATKERAFDQFFLTPAVERAWHQAKGDKEGE